MAIFPTSPPANDVAASRYGAEQAEWCAIRDELLAHADGFRVSAFDVTAEQRRRMMARGMTPMTLADVLTEATVLAHSSTDRPPLRACRRPTSP